MRTPSVRTTGLGKKITLMVLLGTVLCVRASEAQRGHHALLVGCTEYPNLGERWELYGPENDVRLLGSILTEDFGFRSEDIVRLVGWPEEESRRPTRANIEREFERLAKVGKGDQVVILLAGHGSQQPNLDASDTEEDGLDELFLPADVKGWNGDKGEVENAITDDEIREWITTIRNRGASVWLVADSCHSGTLTRGAAQERDRSVQPEALEIPEEILEAAHARTRSRGAAAEERILGVADEEGGLVAMYAAQPGEVTPEGRYPRPGGDEHGLFTYTIARALKEMKTPLTYAELTEAVAEKYRADGRFHPVPAIEGGDADRQVLGLSGSIARPRIRLTTRSEEGRTRLEISQGHVHGLTTGSILAVYPPAGAENSGSIVGYVQIEEVQALTATVVPIAHDGAEVPKPEALADGSRCTVVVRDFGDLRLKVALQSERSRGEIETHARGEGPANLARALEALDEQPKGLVEWVGSAAEAQWLVRAVGSEVLLVPAAGWSLARYARGGEVPTAPPQFTLGDSTEALRSALVKIAGAQHLLSLAGSSTLGAATANGGLVDVELLEFEDGTPTPMSYRGGRVLRAGERIAIRVRNSSDAEVDVTLLFVDSAYGIQALYPTVRGNQHNRLAPGDEFSYPGSLPGSQQESVPITEDTIGPEQVIVIAVLAEGESRRADFSYLQQDGLQLRTRGEAERSPLQRLLDRARYGDGGTRGLGDTEVSRYSVRALHWQTLPAEPDG